MEKQTEIRIFVEELWQNIMAMTAGSDLTGSDLLEVWGRIRERIEWQAKGEEKQSGSTKTS